MAGLLSAIGGALAGVGEGIAAQAKEDGLMKREARLAELQHANRMTEMQAQQQHQTSEREATQSYTTQRDATRFGQEKEMAGVQHGYRVSEIGAQAGATQANTRLSNELQAGREREERQYRSGEAEKDRRYRSEETERDRGFRSGEAERDRRFRSGEAEEDRTFRAGESEKDRGFRSGEAEKAHGRKLEEIDRTAAAKQTAGATMSEGDRRIYDAVVERHTEMTPDPKDPYKTIKQTNWTAVGRDLRARGREDLAKIAIGEPDPSAWTSVEIPKEYRAPPTGERGTPTGGAPADKPQTSAPTQQPSPPSTPQMANSKPPAGGGTKDNPFKATTQADIDWFKASAPAGSIISINGQLYKK